MLHDVFLAVCPKHSHLLVFSKSFSGVAVLAVVNQLIIGSRIGPGAPAEIIC